MSLRRFFSRLSSSRKKPKQKKVRVSSSEGPRINQSQVAYAVYSTISDACEECQKLEGLHVLLTHPAYRQIKLPNPHCQHKRGCACVWTYTFKEEQGSQEIVEFLKQNGGKATQPQVGKFRNAGKTMPHIETIGECITNQVDFMLNDTEQLKTTRGKLNRLRKYHENLLKMDSKDLEDEQIQASIAKVESRIQELEAEMDGGAK